MNFVTKNTKMIRMVYFIQKSEDFNFLLLGGSGQKSRQSVRLFDFDFLVLNILKEADINFFFKVLAKFGDNKHNKDIQKKCGIFIFFSTIFLMSLLCLL